MRVLVAGLANHTVCVLITSRAAIAASCRALGLVLLHEIASQAHRGIFVAGLANHADCSMALSVKRHNA